MKVEHLGERWPIFDAFLALLLRVCDLDLDGLDCLGVDGAKTSQGSEEGLIGDDLFLLLLFRQILCDGIWRMDRLVLRSARVQ